MAKNDDFSEGGSHPFDDFQIGDQVEHAKFGVGTILFRSGSGESSKVIVVFSEEGQKKLALKYAKLRKISEGKPRIQEHAPAVVVEKPKKQADEFEAPELEDEDLEEVGVIAGDEEETLLPPDDEADIPFGDEGEEIPFGEDEDEEP